MSVLAGAPLHSTVIAALRSAGQRISHPVDTRDLLVALIQADESAVWSRILLHTGDIDAIAGKIALDPVNRGSDDWYGMPVTGTCAAALDSAGRLAQHYGLWPLPPGILALGLIADESSSAAQVLGDGLERGELLRLIQSEVLGTSLFGLEAALPGIVAAARKPQTTRRKNQLMKAPEPPRPAPFGSLARVAGAALACGICGCTPAAEASFNRHEGFLLYLRFVSVSGTFCRNCGLATYRSMCVKSLWLGWWGPISLFVNLVVLLTNLPSAQVLSRLPPPVLDSGSGVTLNPGRPLHRRPSAIAGMLIPVIAIGALAIAIIASDDHDRESEPPHAAVGTCFDQVPWVVTTIEMKQVPCSDPRARAEVVAWFPRDVDGVNECPKRGGNGYRKDSNGVVCMKTR